jgi:DNA invertase Pin-like site-specific DNA recombinase
MLKMESQMPVYAYARVSTGSQSLAAQIETLKAAGAEKVFSEKASGVRSDRPALARLIKALAPGDQVIVTRLDRLARSTRDLLNVLDQVSRAGATFKSLSDTWADTTTPHGRLMLTILGGLAEFERELIRQRTSEGRARAKARGQHLGRPHKLNKFQREEAMRRHDAGETLVDIGRSFNVSHMTVARAVELESVR